MNHDRDLKRLRNTQQALVDSYFAIAPQFEQQYPGSEISVPATGGFRPPELQARARLDGKSPYDGKMAFSKHQVFPAEALDFSILEGGVYVSNGADPRYAWVGHEFERDGFKWGGTFRRRVDGILIPAPDWDHVELPGEQPTREEVMASLELFEAQESKTT